MSTTSKTSRCVSLYRQGKLKEALKIAKDFQLGVTRLDRKALALAYECLVHPEFYVQLGVNLDQAVAAGKEIIEARIIHQPETAPQES